MINKFLLASLLCLSWQLLNAQRVIYANPLLENELAENKNPAYIVGFLNNNILIGKINELNGFYISVYNNKLGLINNVLYKELNLNYFDIIDIVNMNDAGILYTHRKPQKNQQNSIIYTIIFSDTGVPIREAHIIDSLPDEWNLYEKKFLVKTSSNKQYSLLLTYVQSGNEYWARAVLINEEGEILQHYQWNIPIPTNSSPSKIDPEIFIDNTGNSYIMLTLINSQGFVYPLFFQGSASDSKIMQYPVDIGNLQMHKIKISLDDLHDRIFFYGIYENHNKTDARGFYGVWWDKKHNSCYGARAWPLNELMPKLKGTQQNNLEIGKVIFMKTGGFICNTINENTQKIIPLNNIGIGLGAGINPTFYNNFPINSSTNQNQYDIYSENAYVFIISKNLKVKATHTIYKHQQQHNERDLLGIHIFNTGNLLYYLYNEFQKTGNITLSSYVLDPKYQFIKKSLNVYADNNFIISLSLGKQISPFAYLTPCTFKNKWRSFALIVL